MTIPSKNGHLTILELLWVRHVAILSGNSGGFFQ